MYEKLKSDQVTLKFGGRFRLASAIQRRWLELMQGSRALVAKQGNTHLETAMEELLEGRIDVHIPEKSTLPPIAPRSSSLRGSDDE